MTAPLLDGLADAGVNHVELRCIAAGGRWLVSGHWVGNRPDEPMTLATEIGSHVELLPSLEAAIEAIAAQAADTPPKEK